MMTITVKQILAVYVFTRLSIDGAFTQQSKLHANDAAASDLFGHSVSLYGDTALIGALGDDDNGQSNSGSVYVFTRSSTDGTFTQQSKIHASDAAADDYFGIPVSLYGDTALIGAHKDGDNDKSNSGSVYVFKAPYLQWYLAKSSNDDCDVVCTAHGKACDVNALQFDYVALSGNYVDLFAAASSAGISCNNGGGVGSISAPIYHNGNCYQYNTPSNQVCSGSVGFGLRICPCV